MNTRNLIILGIIVIVVIVAYFIWSGKNSDDVAGLIVGQNAIYVAEQTPGKSLTVTVVRLEKPGFVVVHGDNDDAPGEVLGFSGLLPAGETKDLPPITLQRELVDSEVVYAMLHFDDGDSIFDAAKDQPALDSTTGEPVMMIVQVSQDASAPEEINL